MFSCLLGLSTSWEIVIFCLAIFTQNMQYQRRSYSQCQALNIVMSNAKTPLYTIQWREDAANCNGNCRMWLLLVVFYTASVKISKKCQSITSFSINDGTMYTLPLTYFLSNVIRTQPFDLHWSTSSKSLQNYPSATHQMDSATPKSNNIKAKGPDRDLRCVSNCSMLLSQPIPAVQCIISSNINSHWDFYLHNLISVKDNALTLIGNKSAMPCRFLLQLLWIVYQILLPWYPQVAVI